MKRGTTIASCILPRLWLGIGMVVACLSGCTSTHPIAESPPGTLDFRQQPIEGSRPLPLQQAYGFWWDTLLPPQSFPYPTPPHYARVPRGWNDLPVGEQGERAGSAGVASYTLLLVFDSLQQQQPLTLRINRVREAYALYLNGVPVARQGQVAPEIIGTETIPRFVTFTPRDTVHLLMHVANRTNYIGGLTEAIQLGPPSQIHRQRLLRWSRDIFLLGGLLLIGVYHIILNAILRQSQATLWFGIMCILLAFRSSSTGEHVLYDIFPHLPLWAGMRIEYGTLYLGPLVVMLFFQRTFPKDIPQWLITTNVLITIPLIGSLLAPWNSWMRIVLPLCQLQLVIMGPVLLVAGIGRAVWHRRTGAWLFLIGLSALVVSAINDVLYARYFIHTGYMISNGLVVLVLCQAAALSLRLAKAYVQVEVLHQNLEIIVKERTRELSNKHALLEEQRQLIYDRHADLESSLKYAWRIQKSILGSTDRLTALFSRAYVFFKPKGIITGDFYWSGKVHTKTLVAVGDVVGQGVPSAFVTMMTHAFLNNLVFERQQTEPAHILTLLNEQLQKALKEQPDKLAYKGLRISLVVIDEATHRLTLSSAAQHLLYRHGNTMVPIEGELYTVGSHASEEVSFEQREYTWEPQDQLFLYTNGFERQQGGAGQVPYGEARFQAYLENTLCQIPFHKQAEHLAQELAQWQGSSPQTDDILVIGIAL